jgi:metal-responsive CopG/Arc/MetJ family transcriptional regulator
MEKDTDPIIRKSVSAPASLWRRIDKYQFANEIKKESEAVRQLFEAGLTPCLPRPLLRAVDDYCLQQRLPSRAEAIRQLIELGLQTTLSDDGPAPYDCGPRQMEKA